MQFVHIALFTTALLSGSVAFADLPCVGADRSETISVPGHPFAVVPTNDGCWLFVSLETGKSQGAVAVLRNEDGHFVLDHNVTLPSHTFGESLSHDGQVLLVSAGANSYALDVRRLEGGGDAIVGTIPHERNAGAIYNAITADDKLLFVSEEDTKRISVYDFAKLRQGTFHDTAPIGHISTASEPVGLALSTDAHWLYATNEVGPSTLGQRAACEPETRDQRKHPRGLLLVIDVQKAAVDPAHALIAGYPAGCNPVRVAASPDGKHVYVTARGDNRLLRFQTSDWANGTGQVSASEYAIGTSPVGVVARPDGKQVWVALSNRFGKDSAGQLVGIEDASADAPDKLLSAPAPGFPREVVFLPDGKTIVATLFDANQVELVRTP